VDKTAPTMNMAMTSATHLVNRARNNAFSGVFISEFPPFSNF